MKCPFCNGCGSIRDYANYFIPSGCKICNGNGIVDDHYYEKKMNIVDQFQRNLTLGKMFKKEINFLKNKRRK